MTTNPGHKPEQPSRAAVSPHGREHRLRRTLHRGWEAICISTALCDFCGRRSRGVVQKCLRCGLSICSPCSRAGALGGNRNHRLDHDAVCWDGAALQTGRGRGARHLVVSPTEPDAPARKQQLDRRRGLARSHAATIQDERGGRQRRRGRCEMATQTPSAWWLAVQTGRNASLSPDTEVECRVDEQDVAAILARMPLSETVFRRDDPSREQQQFLPRVD